VSILIVLSSKSFEMIPESEVLKEGLKFELHLNIITTIINCLIQGIKAKNIIKFLHILNKIDEKVSSTQFIFFKIIKFQRHRLQLWVNTSNSGSIENS
jgi:heme/copper-type cytochrome/quinol oxidase subunit 4